MKDIMKKKLATAMDEDNAFITNFNSLVVAKEKEIASNSEVIESKTTRLNEVGVTIVIMKEDLNDIIKALIENKKFLVNLETDCKIKETEYDVVKMTCADEMLTLADTIKILSDDDVLDLFKKTLLNASLFQSTVLSKQLKQQELLALLTSKRRDPHLNLISVVLKGRKVNLSKVLKKIDEMVALLGKEQKDDEIADDLMKSIINFAP